MVTATNRSVQLGAYEIVTRTKTFPRPFWAAMEQQGEVLVEMSDGAGGFTVSWVKAELLLKAVEKSDVRLIVEV